MLESTHFATPIVIKDKPTNSDGDSIDIVAFRSIVGALQYLTFTQPDIIHAINKVFQHFNNPTLVHFKAVKLILRYLKGTQHFDLRYLSQSPATLYGFSYAD